MKSRAHYWSGHYCYTVACMIFISTISLRQMNPSLKLKKNLSCVCVCVCVFKSSTISCPQGCTHVSKFDRQTPSLWLHGNFSWCLHLKYNSCTAETECLSPVLKIDLRLCAHTQTCTETGVFAHWSGWRRAELFWGKCGVTKLSILTRIMFCFHNSSNKIDGRLREISVNNSLIRKREWKHLLCVHHWRVRSLNSPRVVKWEFRCLLTVMNKTTSWFMTEPCRNKWMMLSALDFFRNQPLLSLEIKLILLRQLLITDNLKCIHQKNAGFLQNFIHFVTV